MQSQEETLDESSEEKFFFNSNLSESDKNFFGPALPPHLMEKNFMEYEKKESTLRPTLPDHLREKEKEKLTGSALPVSEPGVKVLIGPEIPEYLKSNLSLPEADEKPVTNFDEEDNFGPSTTLMAIGDAAYYKFKNTQNLNKQNLHNASESNPKRETWMTELPEKKGANFGLFPRHFKSRIQTEKESDDSVWTETPAEKKEKDGQRKIKDHKEILQMRRLKERDREMEKLVRKAAKKLKKKESLLAMHLESMKNMKKAEIKKRKKEGKTLPERRPFDRNVDLQIRKIDDNQKRAILYKSQFLNDRFAPGQSKFL